MSVKLCRTIVICNNTLYFLHCFISHSYLNSDVNHTGVLVDDEGGKIIILKLNLKF